MHIEPMHRGRADERHGLSVHGDRHQRSRPLRRIGPELDGRSVDDARSPAGREGGLRRPQRCRDVDPPASDGGSPITGYTVISDTDGTTATRLGSPCTVSGLTNGRPYSFHVIARNAVGASSVSTSSTLGTPAAAVVPPTGTTPTAPDRVEPSTGSALASTGPANSSSAFAAGALLLGAGVLTLVVARRRRRRA